MCDNAAGRPASRYDSNTPSRVPPRGKKETSGVKRRPEGTNIAKQSPKEDHIDNTARACVPQYDVVQTLG